MTLITTVAILAGVATLAALFKPLFGDWEELIECICIALQPDILSWFQGELGSDWWAEIKLGFWFFCSLAAGYGTHIGLTNLFGG